MNTDKSIIKKEAFAASLPVVMGYFPIAMAYGLLAKNTGLSVVEAGLTSGLIYAGAAQFMALDLFASSVATGSIILTTFLLNLRYFVMSASLSVNLKEDTKPFLPLIGFGITDETFSVLSFNKDKLNSLYVLIVNVFPYLSWTIGTIIGHIAGELLPLSLQTALGLGLYGLFAALLFPSFKGETALIKISMIAVVMYTAIFKWGRLSSGWDIILGIVLSTALGILLLGKELE
ncbi:MAG: AzlC family ABC transporter permease [Gudongella sp.]|jgi:4-azaleucine resistance transporter AzlC|nr:AzlC family ABC transporter permease [Gudongella sp.]